MFVFKQIQFLKIFVALQNKNVLSHHLPKFSQAILSKQNYFLRPYSINYKTPTNRSKVFKPETIAVTNANKHLEIELFDQNEKDLGKMSMEKAKDLANRSELKLVITNDSTTPPKFKLMSGNELYKMQIKTRNENKFDKENTLKVTKEKEIDINLGISEHDLEIKIKMAQNFYEKGHSIKIKIISKIVKKSVIFFEFFFKKILSEIFRIN